MITYIINKLIIFEKPRTRTPGFGYTTERIRKPVFRENTGRVRPRHRELNFVRGACFST